MDFLAVNTTSYYFMEVNFSISLFFPEIERRKKEEKEKPRKTITTALPPKNYQIIFAWLLKDSKSQNKKHN